MNSSDVKAYNEALEGSDKQIADRLSKEINESLQDIATNKVWHGAPVWFINGNPVVGYAKRKNSVQLLFWSGQSFDEPGLAKEGSFKAAEANFTSIDQINSTDLQRWLKKAATIQWDYKNIVKRRGVLERLV